MTRQSTYQAPFLRIAEGFGTRSGLTDPAVIEAYVNHRVNDPSLLSRSAGPSYADFLALR